MIKLTLESAKNRVSTYQHLVGFDLSGLDLREMNLKAIDFRGSKLVGADLSGSDISFANLQDVDLTDSTVVNANLCGATFAGAELLNSDLSNSNLSHCNFTRNIKWDSIDYVYKETDIASLKNVKFTNADLRDSTLSFADLRKSSFYGAKFNNWTSFYGANLRGADLRSETYQEAVTYKAKIRLSKILEKHVHGFGGTGTVIHGGEGFRSVDLNFPYQSNIKAWQGSNANFPDWRMHRIDFLDARAGFLFQHLHGFSMEELKNALIELGCPTEGGRIDLIDRLVLLLPSTSILKILSAFDLRPTLSVSSKRGFLTTEMEEINDGLSWIMTHSNNLIGPDFIVHDKVKSDGTWQIKDGGWNTPDILTREKILSGIRSKRGEFRVQSEWGGLEKIGQMSLREALHIHKLFSSSDTDSLDIDNIVHKYAVASVAMQTIRHFHAGIVWPLIYTFEEMTAFENTRIKNKGDVRDLIEPFEVLKHRKVSLGKLTYPSYRKGSKHITNVFERIAYEPIKYPPNNHIEVQNDHSKSDGKCGICNMAITIKPNNIYSDAIFYYRKSPPYEKTTAIKNSSETICFYCSTEERSSLSPNSSHLMPARDYAPRISNSDLGFIKDSSNSVDDNRPPERYISTGGNRSIFHENNSIWENIHIVLFIVGFIGLILFFVLNADCERDCEPGFESAGGCLKYHEPERRREKW